MFSTDEHTDNCTLQRNDCIRCAKIFNIRLVCAKVVWRKNEKNIFQGIFKGIETIRCEGACDYFLFLLRCAEQCQGPLKVGRT